MLFTTDYAVKVKYQKQEANENNLAKGFNMQQEDECLIKNTPLKPVGKKRFSVNEKEYSKLAPLRLQSYPHWCGRKPIGYNGTYVWVGSIGLGSKDLGQHQR